MLTTSCRRGAPPPAVTPTATVATSSTAGPAAAFPELRARSWQELDYGQGTKGRVWTLTGQQLKSLTAKLVVARDGQKLPGTEIKCTWDVPSPSIEGQLVMLLEDGSAFGAKGKRRPSMALQFRSGGPDGRKSMAAGAVHDTLPPRASSAATDSTVSNQEVLFYEISGDSVVGETISIGGSEESLIEASKNKRLVVGVLIEWNR
jgi:hypothetical protein